jgi:tetratricopeptide (TPR) repeat protein
LAGLLLKLGHMRQLIEVVEGAPANDSHALPSEIEVLLARAELTADPALQSSLLLEASQLYEEQSETDRAFMVRATAYRVSPTARGRVELERLAVMTGQLGELDALISETLPSLAPEARADAACDLGRLRLKRLRAPDRAVEALDVALALGRSDEALTLRADALEELGRFAELASVLEALAAGAQDEEAARVLMRLCDLVERSLGDAHRAEEVCRRALVLAPNNQAALTRLERLIRARNDLPALLALVEDRIAAAPLEQQTPLLRQAAELCETLGRSVEAAACHEELRARTPGDLSPLRALERLYGELGRIRQQIDVLEELVGLVESKREHAALHDKLATAWMELGDPARAIPSLEWQMAYDPAGPAFAQLCELYRAESRFGALADAYARHLCVADARRRRTLRIELADIYERNLGDLTQAIACWQAILDDDERDGEALEALARLYESIEDFAAAAQMSERWAALAGDGNARALRLAQAAAFTARVDETSRAHRLFLRAHEADPSCLPARLALTASHRRRGELQRADQLIAAALAGADGGNPELVRETAALREAEGDLESALTLRRALITRLPDDPGARKSAASLALRLGRHDEALQLLAPLPDDGEVELRVDRWLLVSRAAHAAGKLKLAAEAITRALELAPESFEVGRVRAEQLLLDRRHEEAHAIIMALDETRDRLRPSERAALALLAGDCAQARGYSETALRRYREAVSFGDDATHRPALRKALDVAVEVGSWDESLNVLAELTAIEQDLRIRARYRHLAGHICDENLGDYERALTFYRAALDDDPDHPRAAERIEGLLRNGGDFARLAEHCAHLIERLGGKGDPLRRARLWSVLAEAASGLGDREGMIAALEVVGRLDPEERESRRRLAVLYLQAGAHAADKAIAAQHELLRVDPAYVPAYRALEALYERTGQLARAQACEQAARMLVSRDGTRGARRGWAPAPDLATRPLAVADWALLRHPDEDRFISQLAALVAPLLTATAAVPIDRARRAPGEVVPRNDMRPFVQATNHAARILGLPVPELVIAPEQTAPMRVVWTSAKQVVQPLVVVGMPLLGDARRMIDILPAVALDLVQLRPERNARVLIHDPNVLAVLMRAVVALAYDEEPEADARETAAALKRRLQPVVLDQLGVVGRRLREDGRDFVRLAAAWLRAADLTAARVALVMTGDLPRTIAAVEARAADENAARAAVLELTWASITDALWTVRERIVAAAAESAERARASV